MAKDSNRMIAFTVCLLVALGWGSAGAAEPNVEQLPDAQALERPPLILVSLDAYRRSYLDSFDTPHLRGIAAEGVSSTGMRPCFPSITFPCHYTLVTGWYPQDHGIIDNTMYDETGRRVLSMASRGEIPSWSWRGEPIWVTAGKQGLKTATMYWPSSEVLIQGRQPTYWHPFIAQRLTYEQRVDQILSWLDLPSDQRPAFIGLYLEATDAGGHEGGPSSIYVRDATSRVDSAIGRLVRGLEARKLFDEVNLIVTADHGMTEISTLRTVYLSDVIDTSTVAVGPSLASGPSYIWLSAKNGDNRALLRQLKRLPHVRAYLREKTPARLHVRHYPGDLAILVMADDQWQVFASRPTESKEPKEPETRGFHGYDSGYGSMKVIFIAHGPDFRSGAKLGEFDSVDVYPLLAHLLKVTPAENSGRLSTFNAVLKSHPPH